MSYVRARPVLRGSLESSRELPAGCSRPKAVLLGAKKRFLGVSEWSPSSLGSPPAPRELDGSGTCEHSSGHAVI